MQQRGLLIFSAASLMALANGLNLTARMNDETSDNVQILTGLPIGSNTATVEEQEMYLKEAEIMTNNPMNKPGYIPGQPSVINHNITTFKLPDEISTDSGIPLVIKHDEFESKPTFTLGQG